MDPIFAEGSTTSSISMNSTTANPEKSIFNLPLSYWRTAKFLFCNMPELRYSEFKYMEKEMYFILINLCCSSLESLGGVSIKPPDDGKTPCLMTLYDYDLPKKGWKLKEEKPALYLDLNKMYREYFLGISKHLNTGKDRAKKINQLDHAIICQYMQTTREIWLWCLNKIEKGCPDKSLLVHFDEEICNNKTTNFPINISGPFTP